MWGSQGCLFSQVYRDGCVNTDPETGARSRETWERVTWRWALKDEQKAPGRGGRQECRQQVQHEQGHRKCMVSLRKVSGRAKGVGDGGAVGKLPGRPAGAPAGWGPDSSL